MLLEWDRALVIAAALKTTVHLPPIAPVQVLPPHVQHLSLPSLGGLPDGVTEITIPKVSEPFLILPFLDIYYQITQGICEKFPQWFI